MNNLFFQKLIAILTALSAMVAGISSKTEPLGAIERRDVSSLRTYNSKTYEIENGKKIIETHSKWIHYFDESGNWKGINEDFQFDGVKFVMNTAPFFVEAPARSTGIAKFINNNRYDPGVRRLIDEQPLTQTIQALGVADTAGEIEVGNLGWGNVNYVIYRNAYPSFGADLIYYVHTGDRPTLKKLIRFNHPDLIPTSDFSLQFDISYDQDVTIKRSVSGDLTRWTKLSRISDYKEKIVIESQGKRGNGIGSPRIWESYQDIHGKVGGIQKNELIKISLDPLPHGFRLTKHIPVSFFSGAKFPVYTDTTTEYYPDPSSGASTIDGTVRRNADGTWLTIHDAAGDTVDVTNASIASYYSSTAVGGTWSLLQRAIFIFDTSNIGSTSTVSSSTLVLRGNDKNDECTTSPLTWNLYKWTGIATNTLATTDYASSSFGTDPLSTAKTQAGWSTTADNAYLFNATGTSHVSSTGYTKIGWRNADYDAARTAPANCTVGDGNMYVQAVSADTAATTTDPRLMVEFSAAEGEAVPVRRVIPYLINFIIPKKVFAKHI